MATGQAIDGSNDCVAGNLLDNYQIINPITGGTAIADNSAFNPIGLNLANLAVNQAGNGITNTALSLADFNNFRKRVAVALDALDRKFEEMVRVANPNCT